MVRRPSLNTSVAVAVDEGVPVTVFKLPAAGYTTTHHTMLGERDELVYRGLRLSAT